MKIILTCGAGASSGFVAQKMRAAAKEKGIDVEVKAVSEAELKDYVRDYDIVLIGPHLRFKLDEIKKIADPFGIPVQIIDEEIYGKLDGEKLLTKTIAYLKDKNPILKQENEANTVEKEDIPSESGNKFMDWMQNSFAPKMNRITANKFIKGIQSAIMTVLPFIMVGSIMSILDIARTQFEWIPDLSLINTFSFGILSLYLAFLIPYKIMDNYNNTKYKFPSALAGVSLYLMLILPVMDGEAGTISFVLEKLGAGGMLVGLFVGIFTSIVMLICSKFSFFKKDTTMPDIVVSWTDSMLPIFIVLLAGVMIYNAQIDVYAFIQNMFSPIFSSSQSFGGIIICSLTCALLYSFGISNWAIFPILWAIWMQGIADNATLVASGEAATNLNLMEFFHGFVYLGGTGTTIVLVVMMLFSKSKRLKAMGRVTIVPSIFNINEPVVFGTPIVFNPLLMIPMWISALIIPTVSYFAFTLGFVNIPTEPFQLWYLPTGVYAYLATQDIRALLLIAVNLAIAAAIYYPFFKLYEKQEIQKEMSEPMK